MPGAATFGGSAMYKHILISTDGSELATRGLDHGLNLAKDAGAEVSIVTVTELWSTLEMSRSGRKPLEAIEAYENMEAEHASHVLDAATKKAAEYGITPKVIHIKDQHPSQGILSAAEETGCDLIVMASHGRRGINRLLLGSQANEVVTLSKVPVLIVR